MKKTKTIKNKIEFIDNPHKNVAYVLHHFVDVVANRDMRGFQVDQLHMMIYDLLEKKVNIVAETEKKSPKGKVKK